MSDTIDAVIGRRVWDSRGRPTVEVEICTASGAMGRAIAPAGASTGSGEALDRRDGGPSRHTLRHPGFVCAVHMEGEVLVTGCYDTVVRIWDVASGQPTRELHGHGDGERACERD